MISVKEAVSIHDILIDKFGGAKGLRDKGTLESALSRPHMTFEKQDLYPTPVQKAAAILESIVKNHPFIDGNKRTGYVLMRLTLMEAGMDIEANQDDKYEFVISVSKGELGFDQIKNWIEDKTKKNFRHKAAKKSGGKFVI